MRAVIHDRYGPPEVLRIGEVPDPEPAVGELLVRVLASSVTRGDAMGVRSVEYRFARLITGIRRPRNPAHGSEFAGTVERTGAGVDAFHAGDEVFGVERGANAQFVVVKQDGAIARKPANLSFEEAAAIPDGALLALSCLRPARPGGKRVLVYGAAGSIGTAAVQLLVNHFSADVTAVCDTRDVDLVRSLGARHVIDRLAEDFTRNGETYDVIFDAVGKHSFRRSRRSLTARGIYLTVDLGYLYHVPLLALATRLSRGRKVRLGIGAYRQGDLQLIRDLVEAGEYRPVIDRTYDLDDVVEATRYVERGQKTGNVVLRVRDDGAEGHGQPPS